MTRKILSYLLAATLLICVVAVPVHATDSTTIYAADIVSIAKDIASKRYKYVSGSSDPSRGGFDCTGLVYYIYHTRLGYNMTLEQARSKSKLLAMGEKITDKSRLLPGDIVQYTIAHVGIYLGNNTVLHAATGGYGVCTTTLENPKWNRVVAYGIRLPGVVQADGTSLPPKMSLTTSSSVSGSWIVTVPANQKLMLYEEETSTNSSTYVRAQSKAYQIVCSTKATLSNGEIRYCGAFNENDHYWLIFSNDMTVEDRVKSTYTVTFDPNGGDVDQTTQVIEKGSAPENMPTPVRSGYIFRGWALDKIDPNFTGVTTTTIFTENAGWAFDEDTTLYAFWVRCTNHQKGSYLWYESSHPHYNYYICSICGAKFTDDSTNNVESCKICNPDSKEPEKEGYWTDWSSWSTTPVSETNTRQVEKQSVKTSDASIEYRYGRYVYYDYRRHECWCEAYMTKLFGSATLQYSDWSTTRYSPTGKGWTCGNCRGNHIGVDHYTNGKPWWAEYYLPDGDYFWEESRTVNAQYETQYRYRDWISN